MGEARRTAAASGRSSARGRGFLLVLLGAAGCSKPGGAPSSHASIAWADGGGPELVVSGAVVPLPAGDLGPGDRPTVLEDEAARRLAYRTKSGDARLVYRVGEGWFVGPMTKSPIDMRAAPEMGPALGAIFEHAIPNRRAALVAEVKKEGEAKLVTMLVAGVHVEAPEWEDAYAHGLSPKASEEVRRALAARLEPGGPTEGLRRAVVLVPLREPARAPALEARVRELVTPVREPRAAAVMLRALAVLDRQKASALGCEVLARKPLDTADVKGTPATIDIEGRALLVEAALVAIANGAAAGAPLCKEVDVHLGDDPCLPSFRCGPDGPLTGRETSKQDEPMCDKAQLKPAVERELERSPLDVATGSVGARAPFFAFAALSQVDRVPSSVTAAHARRRYALTQPKEPSCESVGLSPGTPCRCEEAIIRDQTCRHEAGLVHVGLCKFTVDDKQKKIVDVVASLPP